MRVTLDERYRLEKARMYNNKATRAIMWRLWFCDDHCGSYADKEEAINAATMHRAWVLLDLNIAPIPHGARRLCIQKEG